MFALEQNYPNPFNNTTVIKYSLPKTTYVTIKFYNILGQIVHAHKVDNMAPGYYSYLWNGRNDLGQMISSGIYFYQLEAVGFFDVKKMVLLK
ncbi:MAG: T9SS type A sorting domain-containing protein [bacterium]